MERTKKILLFGFVIIVVCLSADYFIRDLRERNEVHRWIDDVGKMEDQDPLHPESCEAVSELIKIGYPALKRGGLELLISDNLTVRMRAQNLLSMVTARDYGRTGGAKEWVSDRARLEWLALWRENGAYHAFAMEDARKESYLKWKRWVEKSR